MPDYRYNCTGTVDKESAIKEINFMFKHWQVRLIVPKFGLSVWKDQTQKARLNYPTT